MILTPKQYVEIIKPKIVLGNLVSLIGGFLLASKGNIDFALLIITLIGVSLVIASSCVFNNYIDIDIDRKMQRTKNRVLVRGVISSKASIKYAIFLGIIGFSILLFKLNKLAYWITIIGYIVYILIYSLYMKRYSIYSTLIGSISGATPPLIGYCAVTGKFDIAALTLFMIFVFWQMLHFYAIAIFYIRDYKTANIPVLPIVKGILTTKNHIVLYVIGYIISILMLVFNGYVGYIYLIVAIILGCLLLSFAIQAYKSTNDSDWAYKIFSFSIFFIIVISIMMSIDFIPNYI